MDYRQYLSVTETAKLIRAALKREFPGVKFSVKSEKYAGGASIDIRYIDGPTSKQVDDVTHCFSSKGFDGMIDMQYSKRHWMLPDGQVIIASSPGTTGSAGSVSPVANDKPHPEAVMVSFGADYVFVNRSYSADAIEQAVSELEKDWGVTRPENFKIIDSNFPTGSSIFVGGNEKFNNDPHCFDRWNDKIHRHLKEIDLYTTLTTPV